MAWNRVVTKEGWARLWGPCLGMWAAFSLALIHPFVAVLAIVCLLGKRMGLDETIHDHLLPHDEPRAPVVEINRQKALQVWWYRCTGQVREVVECPARLASWCRAWANATEAALAGACGAFVWERAHHLDAPFWAAFGTALCCVWGLRAAERYAAGADWLGRHHRLPLAAVAAPLWPRAHIGLKRLWEDDAPRKDAR